MNLSFRAKGGILTLILLIFILLISSVIYFIGNKTNSSISANSKNIDQQYFKIKNQVNNLGYNNLTQYTKALGYLSEFENSTTTKEQYDKLLNATNFLQSLYSATNDNKLYKILQDIDMYAKNKFSNQYLKQDFYYPCQDKDCADSPQPKEILNVIEELKTTIKNEEIKQTFIRELTNSGYETKNDNDIKVQDYLITSESIRGYDELINLKLHDKIADEIVSYVKMTFPKEYEIINNAQKDK